MANWIHVKKAAAKYGTTEEVIRSWAKLRYISYSTLDGVFMIDDDSVQEYLDANETKRLNTAFQGNEEMELIEKLALSEEKCEKWKESAEEMKKLCNSLIIALKKSTKLLEEIVASNNQGFWAFLSELFGWKKRR